MSVGDEIGKGDLEVVISPEVTLFRPAPLVSFIDNITFHPVPEPSTLALLGLAIAGLGPRRRRSAAGSVSPGT